MTRDSSPIATRVVGGRKVRTLTNFVSERARNYKIEYPEYVEGPSFDFAQDVSIRDFALLRRIGQVAGNTRRP